MSIHSGIKIYYRNYRGEVALRTILPVSIWFGASEFHKESQWFLCAHDFDRNAPRDFALRDFLGAAQPAPETRQDGMSEDDLHDWMVETMHDVSEDGEPVHAVFAEDLKDLFKGKRLVPASAPEAAPADMVTKEGAITLPVSALWEILDFVNPDGRGDTEQLASEIYIQWDANGHAGSGYYAWSAECPEEGCIALLPAPPAEAAPAACKCGAPPESSMCGKPYYNSREDDGEPPDDSFCENPAIGFRDGAECGHPRACHTPPVEASQQIEIADHVHHEPSGENWVVARVTEQSIYPAGWPSTCARIEDCTLIKKATAEQREEMIEALRKLPSSDSRHIAEAK